MTVSVRKKNATRRSSRQHSGKQPVPRFRIQSSRYNIVQTTPGADDAKGTLPYASELVGQYQPLWAAGKAHLIDDSAFTIVGNTLTEANRIVPPSCKFDGLPNNPTLLPVGLLHTFREFFYDGGTFLGPPVAHVWVAPGSTVELIETTSQRKTVTQSTQTSVDEDTSKQLESDQQEDLVDVVKYDNDQRLTAGASASTNGGIGVWNVSASAHVDYDTASKQAREETRKTMRKQTEKLSTDIRRSIKTSFQTVTETTASSSRRYVIQNNTDRLINYELRRKMRKVVVQAQHPGASLCLHYRLPNPGLSLGLSGLVVAAADPFSERPPTTIVAPTLPSDTFATAVVEFDWQPVDDSPAGHNPGDTLYRAGGSAGADTQRYFMKFQQNYPVAPPAPGWTLKSASVEQVIGGQPANSFADAKISVKVNPANLDATSAKPVPINVTQMVCITIDEINWHSNTSVNITLGLVWSPPPGPSGQDIIDQNAAALAAWQARRDSADLKQCQDSNRAYLALMDKLTPRNSDSLREEERTVVLRSVISTLFPLNAEQIQMVGEEAAKTMFDLDSVLYFVAPEWWRPRTISTSNNKQRLMRAPRNFIAADDRREDSRRYWITEESDPAVLGSSLGWEFQLDGDEERNRFINAPWVTVCVPIRTAWVSTVLPSLGRLDPSGSLLANYGQLVALACELLKREDPTANASVVGGVEGVFQTGYNPLAGGIDLSASRPDQIFAEWSEVMPTDQLVAVEY